MPESDGVNYNDITPRWGAAWDVFGTGRTSVKWNMGTIPHRRRHQRHLFGSQPGAPHGQPPAAQLERRRRQPPRRLRPDELHSQRRVRRVRERAGRRRRHHPRTDDTVRYGQDPFALDAAGTPIGLATTQCGRTEEGIPAAVQAYCAAYGETLLDGWGKRQGEWQLGLGVQHEILPRLSGEVTYNRRNYSNLVDVPTRWASAATATTAAMPSADCQAAMLQLSQPVVRLLHRDRADRSAAAERRRLPHSRPQHRRAESARRPACGADDSTRTSNYNWHGVDTNFVWRGPWGMRVNGGTSTGRTKRDTCLTMLDAPNVQRARRTRVRSRLPHAEMPWQTTAQRLGLLQHPVGGRARQHGVPVAAGSGDHGDLDLRQEPVIWNPESACRATTPCAVVTNGVGCLGATRNTTTAMVPLLLNNEIFGERTTSST